MACYHCSVDVVKRSEGQAATAKAAYFSRSRIYDERLGMYFDWSDRSDLAFSQIFLPAGANEELKDRSILWNTAEKAEKRVDGQPARTVQITLPNEVDFQEQKRLLCQYVQDNFVAKGMIADVNMHWGKATKPGKEDNPHAHVLLTMRRANEQGLEKNKEREWNKRINVENWREDWATKQNQAFERLGLSVRVDHRSFERQGLDQLPTIHLGYGAAKKEAQGEKTERGEYNRLVAAYNMEIQTTLDNLKREVAALRGEMTTAVLDDQAPAFAAPFVLYDVAVSKEDMPTPLPENERSTGSEPDLAMLRSRYLDLAAAEYQRDRAAGLIDTAIQEHASQIEDLEERRALLAQYDGRLAQIQEEAAALTGLSWGQRQDLAGSKERIGTSRSQAVETLKVDYDLAPEQIKAAVAERRSEIDRLQEKRAALPDMGPVKARKREIEAEYTKQLERQHLPYPEQSADENKAYDERGLVEQLAIDKAEARLKKLHQDNDPDRGQQRQRDRGRDYD